MPMIRNRCPRMREIRADHHRARSQQGFTLLEILVAIVVISLGLLGLAGLQVVSLNNNQTAQYRSIATQQAYDIADRMRANLLGISGGFYNNLAAIIPADPDCMTNVCSPQQMATADHAHWNANNRDMLPGGSGTVASGANGTFTITVSWTERIVAGANITQSFVTTIAP